MKDHGIPTPKAREPKSPLLQHPPSPPTLCLSPRDQDQLEPAGKGHDQPRLETIVLDGVGSLATGIQGWARTYLKKELMPWQLQVLHGQTALREDGRFLHRSSLVSTARQNGKTVALSSLIGYFLTEEPKRRGEPVKVLSTAHRLDVACELFNELGPVLEEYFGAKLTNQYGRNEARMPDGSRWLVRAAGPSVGHGLSLDLVIADEIWDIAGDAIDQGLVPTMRARPNPLFSLWSTAGTEASTVFLRYREQGLRAIDRKEPSSLYFAEWSPPPELDPMTPAAWEYANPALGYTLEQSTLLAEAESPDRAAFLRASVNLWISTDRGWVKPGAWEKLHHTGDIPAGGIVAVEVSMDDSRYFGVRCVQLNDKRVVATVAFHVDTLAECISQVEQLAKDGRIKFLVTPTISMNMPKSIESRMAEVGYSELLRYTPAVKNMIEEEMLLHTGEVMLAEHVNRAVAVRTQGSIALSSQRSPGPIELARCMVWAAATAYSSGPVRKPMIVVRTG